MSTLLDIVGSVVLFGVLMLTVGRVQTNLNSALYESSFSQQAQANAVALARQIEWDFTKIGYGVATNKLLDADTTSIRFRSDVANNGTIEEIRYRIGTLGEATETLNPLDFPIKRRDSRGELDQLYGTTSFLLRYFDSLGVQIGTPITHADSLARVRSVQASFAIAGREPGSAVDTIYYAIGWSKLIYPRNLSQ